jgi:hypothetical protein
VGTPDSMSDLFAFLSDLMNSNSGLFQAIGLSLFRGFAVILLVWFGAKAALGRADGRRSFHFDQFAGRVLTIAFGYAMIRYYSTPIPGIGSSFYRLITDEGTSLANQLNAATLQQVRQRLDSMYLSMESPTILVLAIALAEAAAFAIRRHYSFGRTCVRPFLHRSADGVVVLELAEGPDAVCLLSRHRERLCLRHGKPVQSFHRFPPAALRFGQHDLIVSPVAVLIARVHLPDCEGPIAPPA